MSYPGPDVQPAGQQPEGAWAPPQGAPQAEPEKKSNAKKWVSIAGTVAVVGIGGAYSLTGGFGIGDPKAGDCLDMTSETEFDVVDCGADEAEARIAGIDGKKLTSKEFDEAPMEEICTDFPTTEYAIWNGEIFTEPGAIYCLESL
jgi:hypothetical protein